MGSTLGCGGALGWAGRDLRSSSSGTDGRMGSHRPRDGQGTMLRPSPVPGRPGTGSGAGERLFRPGQPGSRPRPAGCRAEKRSRTGFLFLTGAGTGPARSGFPVRWAAGAKSAAGHRCHDGSVGMRAAASNETSLETMWSSAAAVNHGAGDPS